MDNPIKVAVVGVGYLGKFHAKIYAAMEDVNLVAVVDANPDVAEEVANAHGCEALTDISDLAQRIDAVSIVVPTSLHFKVSKTFLEQGVHTMLEKPVAPTVEESRQIVQIAKDHGAILQIGHLERFNAGVMKLAELVKSPRFIEVHRLGKFVERATDVDVVTDLMIHDIDIVLSLVDSTLKSISAMGCQVITDHVDIANARLEFENGAVANVTASRVSKNQFRRIRVFADHRYLGLNFADQQLEEVKPGELSEGANFPEIIHKNIKVESQLSLNAELADFVHCVRNNQRPLVAGEDGLIAVEVADLVRQKIAESMLSDS